MEAKVDVYFIITVLIYAEYGVNFHGCAYIHVILCINFPAVEVKPDDLQIPTPT